MKNSHLVCNIRVSLASIEHIGGLKPIQPPRSAWKNRFTVSFSGALSEKWYVRPVESSSGRYPCSPSQMSPLMLFWLLSAVSTAMSSCPHLDLSWLLEILRFSAGYQTQQPCSALSIAGPAWNPWTVYSSFKNGCPAGLSDRELAQGRQPGLLRTDSSENGDNVAFCLMPHWPSMRDGGKFITTGKPKPLLSAAISPPSHSWVWHSLCLNR